MTLHGLLKLKGPAVKLYINNPQIQFVYFRGNEILGIITDGLFVYRSAFNVQWDKNIDGLKYCVRCVSAAGFNNTILVIFYLFTIEIKAFKENFEQVEVEGGEMYHQSKN